MRSLALLAWAAIILGSSALRAQNTAAVIESVQPKIAKIHGAGGLRGLESYQTGIVISPQGHILTAWSYVLDSDRVSVSLSDGRRFAAELVGFDPQREIAIMKIAADDLAFFDLKEAVSLEPGARVLAFSNLYGTAVGEERVSVQRGVLAGTTELSARRGAFAAAYRGRVLVLDAVTNNPGAAGGALTDSRGRLAGLLGKELKNAYDHTWLNYALPIGELAETAEAIRAGTFTPPPREAGAGKPKEHHDPAALGLVLIPDILEKTPPYLESVAPRSPAAKAGLKSDDLIVFVGGRMTPSCRAVTEEMSFIDRFDEVRLTVQRGAELLEITLKATP